MCVDEVAACGRSAVDYAVGLVTTLLNALRGLGVVVITRGDRVAGRQGEVVWPWGGNVKSGDADAQKLALEVATSAGLPPEWPQGGHKTR